MSCPSRSTPRVESGGLSSKKTLALRAALRKLLNGALETAKKEGRSIIIKADRSTPYEIVVAVTNAALEHGIASVALATTSGK